MTSKIYCTAFRSGLLGIALLLSLSAIGQNVGIGTTTPHAELQLSNLTGSRKIVLFEEFNNDHEYSGFGIESEYYGPGIMRYQVSKLEDYHIFYAGVSSNSSKELMRITGNGYVGLGGTSPHGQLHFENTLLNRKIILHETADNNHEYHGFGINAGMLRYQVASANDHHVFFSGLNMDESRELMRITGTGNVSIGTSTPHAQLQLDNTLVNRKIVLHESADNDHEYLGFGINGGMLRYQVANANDNHVFFSGLNVDESRELMRITGAGQVGIGTTTPHAELQLSNLTGSRKIVLFEEFNNDHEYSGFGIESEYYVPGIMRYQVSKLEDYHVFYAGVSSNSSKELMRITGDGYVGLGGTSPHGQLHFENTLLNRKIILHETADNDHEYLGFGINAGMLRYQVAGTTDNHVFYAGSGAETSNELMRITGSGKVGIGTSNPHALLQFSNIMSNRKIILSEAENNDHRFKGFGNNSNELRYQVAYPSDNHVFYSGSSSSTSAELMRIAGSGEVGIGTSTPHALLQLGNTLANRKFVLYENADNDHQYFGLGNNANMLRYQVAGASDNHAFFSGVDPITSKELMRITGGGLVGIGTSAPHALLHLANSNANRKIILFETANNDHQFMGFGNQSDMLRYQVSSNAFHHVFFAGSGSEASNELMRITGFGEVGIGTSTPHALLQLANTPGNRKIVIFENANNDHQYHGLGNNTDMMRYQVAGPTDHHVFFSGINSSSSKELMRITGNGEVGIGTSTPHALLQLANTTTNRKLVLYESVNNDHQYFGLGNNANSMRYQVAGVADHHAFYSGINGTSSKELMRITGAGNVGIGTTAPAFPLTVRTNVNTEGAKVVSLATAISDTLYQLNVTRGSTSNAEGSWMTAIGQAYNGGTLSESIKFFRGGLYYDGAMAFTTNNAERLRVTSAGTIGIGTSTPVSKLDIEGNLTIGAGYGGTNAAPANGAIIEGNVGIGTPAPNAQLQLGNTITNRKLVLYETTNNDHEYLGFGINGGMLRYQVANVNDNHVFFAGLGSSSSTELMRITGMGRVGIGTSSPQGALHIAGSGITAPTQDRNYFNVYSGPDLILNNSSSGNVQVIADGYFWANGGGFVATSDQRIKHINGLSDTKQDLATLNAIEITDYTYIDEIQNGSTPQKKVIAQQLHSVYPQAVNTNAGMIPNVFEVAASSQVFDQQTIITTSKAHEFADGDQVRLILEGQGEKVVIVDVIDTHAFKVDELLSGKIFVYGKHVEDLLNVDYDAVSMLNVSATQELYKMILELRKENEQLRHDLEGRLAKVEAAQDVRMTNNE